MKRSIVWAGTWLTLVLGTMAFAQELEPGFVSLFDGKTLNGW